MRDIASYYYLVTSYNNPALLLYATWSFKGLSVISVRSHTLRSLTLDEVVHNFPRPQGVIVIVSQRYVEVILRHVLWLLLIFT